MLKGRLGLETARVPHSDRHGLMWLSRGRLYVEGGTLRFATRGSKYMASGDYAIPFQMVTNVLLGPGATVSHDAMRLMARHGTGLIAVGEEGVRMYASMPFGADSTTLARRQIRRWSNPVDRVDVARKMYAWRLGEVLPHSEITVLRGIEGSRMKLLYKHVAEKYEIEWKGRRYDRQNPSAADMPNQAINHASSAVEAAAMIAVASTSTLPQLGFIHEDSGNAFCLDIADLFRDSLTIPAAFAAVSKMERESTQGKVEGIVRRMVGEFMHKQKVIPKMIDRIKDLFNANDSGSDT